MSEQSRQMEERIAAGEFEHKCPYPPQLLKDTTEWKAQVKEYSEEAAKLVINFRAALERVYPVSGEKADMLWNKAWEQGHANGWSEILWWYDDLYELVDGLT
jgi:hypothetical protein